MNRTILLVTPDLVARADFNSKGRLLASAQGVPPPGSRDTNSLVLSALILLKAAPRRTWVLTTEAATATLEIHEGRLTGLSEAETAAALSFEAESLTGVNAVSSQTAAQRVGALAGSEIWWVTQGANTLRKDFEAEITRSGGKLEGVAHPGGLARRLSTETAEDFELWGDLLFHHRDQDSGLSLEILPVNESAPPSMLLARFPVSIVRRTLLTSRRLPGFTGADILNLHDDATLTSWFTGWEAALCETKPSIPLLRTPRPLMSGARRGWISVAVAACTALLCYGHWQLTGLQLRKAKEESASLSALVKQNTDLQKTGTEVQKLRSDLKAAQVQRSQALKGFGVLLEGISSRRPEGLLIQSLKDRTPAGNNPRLATGMNATISGVCIDEKLAAGFARDLGETLGPSGWNVSPARTNAVVMEGATLWQFDIPVQLGATLPASQAKR